jgi:SAM-dependent methyltransferase
MIQYFKKEYLEFLVPQRTRINTEYLPTNESSEEEIANALEKMFMKDYDMIREYLPKDASNILDIGCGLGLINIPLYNHYNTAVNLHLLDKTNSISSNQSVRGFNKEYVFYNSMDATRDILTSNGVLNENVHTYEVSKESIEQLYKIKYDLIISLLSCGWHYSIETYMDLIKNTLSPNGVLVLDIRHDTNQLEYAKDNFELIGKVVNTAESKHTGGTIGDRYFFKLKS